ncbi:phospholipid-binding protein MlaC [Paraglaciecola sp. L1A13]|uniref:MlaC/ttg2D family ABC transporter substrate-binding protein n=1 Tax=Paraglaciecola sp. L1A13 TaxID=2686359 RepID=UPI00131DF686|nr:ABC transporter substrate-binding protein [Paraglaciecola sp. L1A13]|tara:strand:- start:12775 stop:13425 length:651 start_codon:yes stop_codon:yes gene_type:complete
MKQLTRIFSVAVILIFSSVASAEEVNPYKLLEDVATKTFARIKDEHAEIQKDPEILRTIIEQDLLPYIDYNFAALKVLGKHFRTVPKEKIPEFIQVFREYLITTYALALTYYNGQDVIFQPMQDTPEDKTATVRAVVREPGRPDIKISFKLRKNTKTNEWKAYDMVAEGISLLSSKQSEYESILRQDGIQKVIDIMKEKIAQPITLEQAKKEEISE